MAYDDIPIRSGTSAVPVSADTNQLQTNFNDVVNGNPTTTTAPTTSLVELLALITGGGSGSGDALSAIVAQANLAKASGQLLPVNNQRSIAEPMVRRTKINGQVSVNYTALSTTISLTFNETAPTPPFNLVIYDGTNLEILQVDSIDSLPSYNCVALTNSYLIGDIVTNSNAQLTGAVAQLDGLN